MKSFIYDKICRTGVLEAAQSRGACVHRIAMTPETFKVYMARKLNEEYQEVCTAPTSDERLAELADLQEVVASLAASYGFTMQQVEVARAAKCSTSGSFDTHAYVDRVCFPAHDQTVTYCLSQPDKYPATLCDEHAAE